MDDYQYNAIMRELTGINTRLDRQNGRLGDAEVELGVLKDRSDRAERVGGIFGAIGGGVTAAIMLWGKKLLGQ